MKARSTLLITIAFSTFSFALPLTIRANEELEQMALQIDAENAKLDRIYNRILAVFDSQIKNGDEFAAKHKRAMIDAERAWIKWRDLEIDFRARFTAAGGTALIADHYSSMIDLIQERQKLLQGFARLQKVSDN